jgi:hypothetical protein
MYENEFYKTITTKKFTHKDVSWLKHLLKELKQANEILDKEQPFWKEFKDITFVIQTKEEMTRRSFHFPNFNGTPSDCRLFDHIRIDTQELDKSLKKPYRLDVYTVSRFHAETTRRFETKEKMLNYFEKLKKKIEEEFKNTWNDMPGKITFIEEEIIRCNELRNEIMARRGGQKKTR